MGKNLRQASGSTTSLRCSLLDLDSAVAYMLGTSLDHTTIAAPMLIPARFSGPHLKRRCGSCSESVSLHAAPAGGKIAFGLQTLPSPKETLLFRKCSHFSGHTRAAGPLPGMLWMSTDRQDRVQTSVVCSILNGGAFLTCSVFPRSLHLGSAYLSPHLVV